ncbi:hypothetical protein RJ639_000664 [Escallonia herrerae]|uniref:Reverse transcriptase Ty1/copia-type domain-containing protein n=1 Tax=Escallonia herrerae TaxID=1293975 RepID=A0AA88XG62_9ASTE|nr:hypothetical protein RJ639_000664 [Escallonia herrerae]
MCPNRVWFATYCLFDGGKVLMGNDVACKMVRIGSIHIRMHDGIVRSLTDVRHVPELRKNLISLGTLDFNGCSYRASSRVMRIMKGTFILMKRLKQNSLYLLQDSTVIGAATSVALSYGIDSDTTSEGYGCAEQTSCPAYVYVNDGKLEPRAKKCIFFGYASGVKRERPLCQGEGGAGVVKHTSIILLLAMVALYDLKLEQLDVKIAFIHGESEKQIFMRQPEEFMIQDKEDHVCLLKKSLYGLKKSPRQWYKRFDTFMVERGYTRSAYDSCVYHQRLEDGSHMYLLLYVDDILIATKMMLDINGLKEKLKKEFEMKDFGVANRILRMEIQRDRPTGILYLS